MKKKSLLFTLLVSFLSPLIVFAAPTFAHYVNNVTAPLINGVLVILYSLCLLIFLWGMAKFILSSSEEAERAKGKKLMLWGLIALFIMTSFFFLVYILSFYFFGVDSPIYLPQ